MIARLAFSILISRKSNILIIDEVFAVGDNSFKKKCHEYVRNFLNKNGTLLMVTHDLATVKEFCNRVIILDQGKKIYDGNVKNLNNFYVKK